MVFHLNQTISTKLSLCAGRGVGKLSKAWLVVSLLAVPGCARTRDRHPRQFPLAPMCKFSQLHALPCRSQTRVQLKTATSAFRFAFSCRVRAIRRTGGSTHSRAQLIALKQRSCCSARPCRHKPPKHSSYTRGQGTRNPSRLLFPWPPLRSCLHTFAFVLYSPLSTTPHRIHSLDSCLAS